MVYSGCVSFQNILEFICEFASIMNRSGHFRFFFHPQLSSILFAQFSHRAKMFLHLHLLASGTL